MVSIYLPYAAGQRAYVTHDEYYRNGVLGGGKHTSGKAYDLITVNQYGRKIFYQPLLAPADGEIIYADYNGNWGNQVALAFIFVGQEFVVTLNHLDSIDPSLFVGKKVKLNDRLGNQGATGFGTGEHLHIEVYSSRIRNNSTAVGFTFYEDPDGTNAFETLTSANSPISQNITNDLDNDGKGDLLWHLQIANNEISTWNGGDRFDFTRLGYQSKTWEAIGTGDFDGDDELDIAWWHEQGEVGYWDDTNRFAGGRLGRQGNSWSLLGIGDLNGDGKDDITFRLKGPTGQEVSTWWGGRQDISSRLGYQSSVWETVGVGDINGDGKDDLIFRNQSNQEVSYWGGGDPLSGAGDRLGHQSTTWSIEAVGDFDGNGKDDIVWTHGNRQVHIWYDGRQSNGTYVGTRYWAGEDIIGVSDLNGDGNDDIITRTNDDKVWQWLSGVQGDLASIGSQSDSWDLV